MRLLLQYRRLGTYPIPTPILATPPPPVPSLNLSKHTRVSAQTNRLEQQPVPPARPLLCAYLWEIVHGKTCYTIYQMAHVVMRWIKIPPVSCYLDIELSDMCPTRGRIYPVYVQCTYLICQASKTRIFCASMAVMNSFYDCTKWMCAEMYVNCWKWFWTSEAKIYRYKPLAESVTLGCSVCPQLGVPLVPSL